MFRSLREDWKELKGSTSGRRFRHVHAMRKQGGGPKRWVRIVWLVVGSVLVLLGPVAGLVPGPGGLVVFLAGGAILARELHPVARALDWLEPKLRSFGRRVKQVWKRSPPVARISYPCLGLALVAGCVYLGYVWLR